MWRYYGGITFVFQPFIHSSTMVDGGIDHVFCMVNGDGYGDGYGDGGPCMVDGDGTWWALHGEYLTHHVYNVPIHSSIQYIKGAQHRLSFIHHVFITTIQ